MSAAEIILIVIGVAVFLLGYLMPARKKDIDEEVQLISEDEVRKLVSGEVEHVKDQIADIVEETVSYSIEKTERAMERVTNEKIMAVNEYSDTVLEEINKNHKEVVFLYDMLNDKHDHLMSAINEATMASDDIRQTVKDAEVTANEAADRLDAVMQAIDDAEEMTRDAEHAAMQVQETAQTAMRSVMDAMESAKNELAALHSAQPDRREVVEEVLKLIREEEAAERAGRGEHSGGGTELPERRLASAYTGIPEEELVADGAGFLRREAPSERTGISGETLTPGSAGLAEEEPPSGGAGFARQGLSSDSAELSAEELPPSGATAAPWQETIEAIPAKIVEAETDFRPISPRRVEIIHQPDGDYVAENEEELSTSAAFASMGFFAPQTETQNAPEMPTRRPRARRSARRDRLQESASAVDIQFAQGKDNGRNSNERILELHKAGKSNMAIAKELGLGLGEVKLVIDLFEGM